MSEKEKFHEKIARRCEVENEVLVCLRDFNEHIGRGVHGGFGIGKRNVEGRLLLESNVEKGIVQLTKIHAI